MSDDVIQVVRPSLCENIDQAPVNDTRAGSITLTSCPGDLANPSSRGAFFDTRVINPPRVAILGTGAVANRSVVLTDDRGRDSPS